jgi:hypothetical protein
MDRSADEYRSLQWRTAKGCDSGACVEVARDPLGKILIGGTGQDAVLETSSASFSALLDGLRPSYTRSSQSVVATAPVDFGR